MPDPWSWKYGGPLPLGLLVLGGLRSGKRVTPPTELLDKGTRNSNSFPTDARSGSN